MIISINGHQGAGKSTVVKKLAEILGWPSYDMGFLRRQAAQKRGLTLAQYNKLGESEPSTDSEVDEYQKELGEKQDNFIISGRTSWYFIPKSLKIYLTVDEKVGAVRILEDLEQSPERKNEDGRLSSVEEIVDSSRRRVASDNLRYRKYWNIDVNDLSNYDLVLDTTNLSIDEVLEKILAFVRKNQQ